MVRGTLHPEIIKEYKSAYNGHKICTKSYEYTLFKTWFYRALHNRK